MTSNLTFTQCTATCRRARSASIFVASPPVRRASKMVWHTPVETIALQTPAWADSVWISSTQWNLRSCACPTGSWMASSRQTASWTRSVGMGLGSSRRRMHCRVAVSRCFTHASVSSWCMARPRPTRGLGSLVLNESDSGVGEVLDPGLLGCAALGLLGLMTIVDSRSDRGSVCAAPTSPRATSRAVVMHCRTSPWTRMSTFSSQKSFSSLMNASRTPAALWRAQRSPLRMALPRTWTWPTWAARRSCLPWNSS
mmetsp:Transcript_4493/g.7956  ORF Transcript_4493/g.7956 Transcript_4493/m.7956 type:complete len:254 (-) Transcript_4493:166-927(-)